MDRSSEIVERCRKIIYQAQKELGENLCGYSTLDLVADQIPDISLSELDRALAMARIPHYPKKC